MQDAARALQFLRSKGKEWNIGVGLQQRCRALGISCRVVYPDAPDVEHQTPTDYLMKMLMKPGAEGS